MKKLYLPLLLILSVLLGGCANKGETRFREFSEELRARSDLELTAEVRAEYDDRSCTFTLRCCEDGQGGCTVEVLEPELIRGVKARAHPRIPVLEYALAGSLMPAAETARAGLNGSVIGNDGPAVIVSADLFPLIMVQIMYDQIHVIIPFIIGVLLMKVL